MKITRLTRRHPWAELDSWASDMTRMFDSVPSGRAGYWPAVNVAESPDELVVSAELPGMRPEDIDLTIENHTLTLSGERTIVREENSELRYHLWEQTSGAFKRTFTLPQTVRSEDIAADYRDGVLTIRLPKAPEAKSRRIEIGSSVES